MAMCIGMYVCLPVCDSLTLWTEWSWYISCFMWIFLWSLRIILVENFPPKLKKVQICQGRKTGYSSEKDTAGRTVYSRYA